MMPISSDQLIFIFVATILLFCFGNSFAVIRRQTWVVGETFWLWGSIALSISYFAYAFSPWFGKASLAIGSMAFVLSYVSLVLQLRFWHTNKSNVPIWLVVVVVLYVIVFEVMRATLPYIARATLGQVTTLLLIGYLVWSSLYLYKRQRSFQILMLSGTFAVEFVCAAIRVAMLWIQPDSTAGTSGLLSEPHYMIAVRWIWVVSNAITYLTVMTYVLEKTFDRNEDLRVLLKEKRQLINAMSKITRSHHAGDVASALTHELSQPLTTLLLLSKSLSLQIKNNDLEGIGDQIDMLCTESERSANIMSQIHKLLRVQNENLQSLQISEVINNAIMVLAPRLSANNITLEKSGRFNCFVSGESTQLELVFINLISNAINILSNQDGPRHIQLECSVNNNNCVVEITDNGPGIDPSILHSIGQIYVSGREQGSGVGLWLTNLILDNHYGTLVASNQQNGGALFRVTLPLLKEQTLSAEPDLVI